jgi:hypothetical protein
MFDRSIIVAPMENRGQHSQVNRGAHPAGRLDRRRCRRTAPPRARRSFAPMREVLGRAAFVTANT